MQFFITNGFPWPTFQNPSEHFLKTINKDFGKVREYRIFPLENMFCGSYLIFCKIKSKYVLGIMSFKI